MSSTGKVFSLGILLSLVVVLLTLASSRQASARLLTSTEMRESVRGGGPDDPCLKGVLTSRCTDEGGYCASFPQDLCDMGPTCEGCSNVYGLEARCSASKPWNHLTCSDGTITSGCGSEVD